MPAGALFRTFIITQDQNPVKNYFSGGEDFSSPKKAKALPHHLYSIAHFGVRVKNYFLEP